MSASEHHANESFLPRIGGYFVCELDPLASVAHIPKDDPAWIAAASLTKTCKRYVACMDNYLALPFPEPKQTNTAAILLLRQGLPDLPDPAMCVPVLPNTHHPSSRRPLRPDPPLPWADCYHESFPGITIVRVTTPWRHCRGPPVLSLDEVCYFEDVREEDGHKRDAIGEVGHAAEVVQPVPVTISAFPASADMGFDFGSPTSAHCASESHIQTDDPLNLLPQPSSSAILPVHDHGVTGEETNGIPSHSGPDPARSIYGAEPVRSLYSLYGPGDADHGQREVENISTALAFSWALTDASIPVVNVWYDLSAEMRVEDPQDFYAEYEEMKRILSEAHDRLAAAYSPPGSPRPRTPISAGPRPVNPKPSLWTRIRAPTRSCRRLVRRILCRPKEETSPPMGSRHEKMVAP